MKLKTITAALLFVLLCQIASAGITSVDSVAVSRINAQTPDILNKNLENTNELNITSGSFSNLGMHTSLLENMINKKISLMNTLFEGKVDLNVEPDFIMYLVILFPFLNMTDPKINSLTINPLIIIEENWELSGRIGAFDTKDSELRKYPSFFIYSSQEKQVLTPYSNSFISKWNEEGAFITNSYDNSKRFSLAAMCKISDEKEKSVGEMFLDMKTNYYINSAGKENAPVVYKSYGLYSMPNQKVSFSRQLNRIEKGQINSLCGDYYEI